VKRRHHFRSPRKLAGLSSSEHSAGSLIPCPLGTSSAAPGATDFGLGAVGRGNRKAASDGCNRNELPVYTRCRS
jgi:hypothetical protein